MFPRIEVQVGHFSTLVLRNFRLDVGNCGLSTWKVEVQEFKVNPHYYIASLGLTSAIWAPPCPPWSSFKKDNDLVTLKFKHSLNFLLLNRGHLPQKHVSKMPVYHGTLPTPWFGTICISNCNRLYDRELSNLKSNCIKNKVKQRIANLCFFLSKV